MIIKNKDNKQDDIDYLTDLLERELSDDKKVLIDRELKCLYSGNKGEETSAYYLDFEFRNSKNWVLIHDLRIEHDGDVAQIDHLLIGRMLDVYVIESKNFTSGVSISDEGDFCYFYNNRPSSIPSPISQNERHIKVLQRFFADTSFLPKRLGITLKPNYRNIVLISPKSRLTKPKKGFYDCSAVMKADKFAQRFKDDIYNDDILSDLVNITKVTSQTGLLDFSQRLVAHHKPLRINFRAKFGIEEDEVAEVTPTYDANIPDCPVCNKPMVMREAKKGKNEGNKFWGCTQYPKCRGVIEVEPAEVIAVTKTVAQTTIEEPCLEDNNTERTPLCPKCNGVMVKRVSKTGKNAGQEFWGCTDFPACRGVLSLDVEENKLSTASELDESQEIELQDAELQVINKQGVAVKPERAVTVSGDTHSSLLVENIDTAIDPLCPKCNGLMVKRVSKQGKNAGQEFWGCTDFPKCRGVVSLD